MDSCIKELTTLKALTRHCEMLELKHSTKNCTYTELWSYRTVKGNPKPVEDPLYVEIHEYAENKHNNGE